VLPRSNAAAPLGHHPNQPEGNPMRKLHNPGSARGALAVALLAVALGAASLTLTLTRSPAQPASRYSLVCSEQLSTRNGAIPIWYPCSARRP
jgi:hypothetical protein